MKKTIRIFGMVLLTILLATVSSACGKDNDDEPKSDVQSIVGTWVSVDGDESYVLTLNNDHTGSVVCRVSSRTRVSISLEERFSWTVSESSSSVKYLDVIHSSGDYIITDEDDKTASFSYILAGQQLSMGGLTFSRR